MTSLTLSNKESSFARMERVLGSQNFFLFALALFVLFRLALLLFVPIEQGSDAAWYHNRAVAIASGLGYTERGVPTAYWPVGYPAFLGLLYSVFGTSPVVGQIANLVLAIASVLLLHTLVKTHFRSILAANLSVLLLAVYPNAVGYIPVLANETLIIFLLLLGSLILLSRLTIGRLCAAGLVFGLGCLIKPQLVFFPGVFLLIRLWMGREPRNFRQLVIFGMTVYVCMAAVLIPWAVRNTLVFGDIVLVSTNSGATLLTGNNPTADGGYSPDDPLVAEIRRTVETQVESDRRARRLAVEWIKENPGRFIALLPLKVWHLWVKDGESEWEYQRGYAHYDENWLAFRTVRWINQLYYVALMAVFAVAIAMALRRPRSGFGDQPLLCIAVFLCVYLSLISMVFSGQPRFHAIAMPFIIAACAATLARWLRRPDGDQRPG